MNKPLPLLTVFNIRITFTPLCIIIYLITIAPLAWLGMTLRGLLLGEALVAGALIALLMFVFENVHQLGHAWAARSVGYPMMGIRHFSWFSGSIYPKDEPPLPPMTHIRRALGGFWINLLIGLALAPLAFYLWTLNGVVAYTVGAVSAWNFFVLGLGALLPIDLNGFTVDGGTILKYWREMRKN